MTESSPGACVPPPGVLPGWNWLPPQHGAAPRLDRVPWWVRAWYRTPLLDRYAHVWMWHHGGWELRPSQWQPPPPDLAGDREPRRPVPPTDRGATDVSGR